MSDEEIGRALGTALAPPEVQAVPDAGARLRARAGRARRDHALVGGSLVAVLGVLLAVGVVRGMGGGAPTAPTAAAAARGYSRLTTPMTVNRLGAGGPAPSPGPCTANAELRCGPAALIVDEVAGLRVLELPGGGTLIQITLTTADAATLRALIAAAPAQELSVRIGQSGFSATVSAGRLRIGMPTPRDAEDFIAALGPFRPVARTGPGRLDVPLQLWTVVSSAGSPCPVGPAAAGTLVTDRAGDCLTLRGPGVSIGTADLGIRNDPSAVGTAIWSVTVDVSGPDAAALSAYTSSHVRQRVAFVVGGRPVSAAPELQGPISAGLELPASGKDEATALVSRMRP